MVELADTLVLGTSSYECRFESCYRHSSQLTYSHGGKEDAADLKSVGFIPCGFKSHWEYYGFVVQMKNI